MTRKEEPLRAGEGHEAAHFRVRGTGGTGVYLDSSRERDARRKPRPHSPCSFEVYRTSAVSDASVNPSLRDQRLPQ